METAIPLTGDGDRSGASNGSSGITLDPYERILGGSCQSTGRPPPHRTAVAHATTTPASHRRHRVGEPRPYDAATVIPVTAAPRHVLTGSITHVPAPWAARTVPATPVSAPVSGSGESDCSGGKTPSGASEDVPWLSFRTVGLWSIAGRQTTRVGRYIADKPSFSPD